MKKQILIRLHIGLNDKHGKHCHPHEIQRARGAIQELFEAFTLTETRGVWKGDQEPAWIVEHYAPDTRETRIQVRQLAANLGSRLDQECVGVAFLPVDSFELI